MHNFSNSKKGETLISIIVGVVILIIAIGGIVMILFQNRLVEEDYSKNYTVATLETNARNIIRKVDTSPFSEKDVFYVYKNTLSGSFQAFTGTAYEKYKYIDQYGDYIENTGSYIGTVYTRIFLVEKEDDSTGKPRQVIKGAIKELIRK